MFAFWSRLDARRKAVVVLASVAVFAAVLGLSRMAATPGMALLYAGLDGNQAGDVLAALDQNGARYEVRGTSIFVESTQRDQLRMLLAGQGLPENSGAGYELLDGLSGFGTTSQMFDAAYWRAKEGELARTIMAGPNVRQARVHIATPSPSPFQRDATPSASVTVRTAGAPVSTEQARAFRFLVASAVAGLDIQNVAIIDGTTGRVIGVEDELPGTGADDDLAQVLRSRVERLLEARVGTGRAVVEVSVDRITESESIVERRIDPESRVAISSDSEESTRTSQNTGGEPVTVASNLPSGDAGAGEGGSSAQSSEIRERVNFDVSEVTREVSRGPGAVKRLTVAVLVDGIEGAEGWRPRSEEELGDLRALVASAVGFDEARGDVITLRSLELGDTADVGTAAPLGLLDRLVFDPMRLIQIGTLALVALVLGLLVVRPILVSRGSERAALADLEPDPVQGLADLRTGDEPVQTQESTAGSGQATPVPGLANLTRADVVEPDEAKKPEAVVVPSLEEDPVGHLKSLIETRQPDTIEILRSWLEHDDQRERA